MNIGINYFHYHHICGDSMQILSIRFFSYKGAKFVKIEKKNFLNICKSIKPLKKEVDQTKNCI